LISINDSGCSIVQNQIRIHGADLPSVHPLRIRKLTGKGKSESRAVAEDWNKASPELSTALEIIRYERNDQLELCDGLELIADQLPDEVNVLLYESIYDKLRRTLPTYHQNEEVLFELISERNSSWVDIGAMLECVRREHTIHNCYAHELYENLEVMRAGSGIRNSSMIGYMLRFCFDSIRRHIAWEDLTLMPLAPKVLTTGDLTKLSVTIQKNRKAIGLSAV